MPPNRFESEVESFLEGSHGDHTHNKRADHHTVTPLCGTLLVMYRLLGSPSLSEIIFSLNNGSKLELSMNVTLAVLPIGAAISGVSAYSSMANPSELEVDRKEHRRAAFMVARQRGLSEREWYKVVEAAKQG